jgi:hypothetical protein
VRWRLEKRAERDRNAQKMKIRKRARTRNLCWRELQLRRDLNYVIVSWNGMIAGN